MTLETLEPRCAPGSLLGGAELLPAVADPFVAASFLQGTELVGPPLSLGKTRSQKTARRLPVLEALEVLQRRVERLLQEIRPALQRLGLAPGQLPQAAQVVQKLAGDSALMPRLRQGKRFFLRAGWKRGSSLRLEFQAWFEDAPPRRYSASFLFGAAGVAAARSAPGPGTAQATSGDGSGSPPPGDPGTNQPPWAEDDHYSVLHDQTLSDPAPGVLWNDFDPDGDPLTAQLVSAPQNGTVTLNPDGSFTYEPNPGFAGQDSFTYRASDGIDTSLPATVWLDVIQPVVDIDVDSNNDGWIDPENDPQLGTDDPIEEDPPGKVLLLNTDDDNANDLPDLQESGPFVDPDGNPASDDDLVEARLSWDSLGLDLSGYQLYLSADPALKLWTTPDKQALVPESFIIGTDPVPETIYLEGVAEGEAWVSWALLQPGGGPPVAEDQVRVTVVKLKVTAYRPQTEGPGYGNPFQKTPVLAAWLEKEELGVGIRRNGDDDNGNGVPDFVITDVAVQNENDLIELYVETTVNPNIKYYIRRNPNAMLNVWQHADKRAVILDNQPIHERQIAFPADFTLWVEWVGPGAAPARSWLELQARHVQTNRVLVSRKIFFYPFQSMVIAFGGFTEVPGDPPNPGFGVFNIAANLYRQGDDVHMYPYSGVNLFGAGPAFDEVASAINRRGVTSVAIFGYSWGGGSTYLLADRIVTDPRNEIGDNNRFNINFTAYIDAIWRPFYVAENRRLRCPYSTTINIKQIQMLFFLGRIRLIGCLMELLCRQITIHRIGTG